MLNDHNGCSDPNGPLVVSFSSNAGSTFKVCTVVKPGKYHKLSVLVLNKVRDAVFRAFLLPFVIAGSVGSVARKHKGRGLYDIPLGNDDTPFLFLHRFPQSAGFDEILGPGIESRQFAVLLLKPSGDEAEFHCVHNVRISVLLSTYHRSKGTGSNIVPVW